MTTLGGSSRAPVAGRAEADCETSSQLLDTRTESARTGLGKLRTLKHGLMDDLLTGRVRVTVPEEASRMSLLQTTHSRPSTAAPAPSASCWTRPSTPSTSTSASTPGRSARSSELIDDLTGKFLDHYEDGHARHEVERYGHYFLGSVVSATSDGQRFVVDGQQRLTTLTLLLIYLHNLQAEREEQVDVRNLIYSEKYGRKSFNLDVPDRNAVMQTPAGGRARPS